MSIDVDFGLLIPHFSEHGARKRILQGTQMAEELDFDIAWVRDHIFISSDHQEHGGIHDPGFITESLTTLGTLTAITEDIDLGTAIITPHRHPVKTAQICGTLDYMSEGRIIVGIGAGWDENEFAAVDMPYEERPQLVRENVDIFRRLWNEEDVSYDGEIFAFDEVTIDPRPAVQPPILYGGLSYRAVEWSAEYCEGWLPSRLPYQRLEPRIRKLHELHDEYGRDGEPTVSVMPQTSVATDASKARAGFDFEKVKHEALERKPVAGDKTDFTMEELEGYLIWGEPADICAHVEAFIDLGVDQITFDMRACFDDYERKLELLGDEVIPQFN
jgi:probable F420-dependent oxidoreductase